MYNEILLEHFQHPRNVGELPPPAVSAEVSNPACGDVLRLAVRFQEGVVAEARYKARGCTASVAAGSVLTEWLRGKSRSEMRELKAEVVDAAAGGLNPESRHAAALCVDAVRAVLAASG